MITSRTAAVIGAFAFASLAAHDASALPRRRFEPNDLELSRHGQLDADLQFGVLTGDGGEVDIPDFEISFGITDNVQAEIDGAFALVSQNGTHDLRADNLWPSAKVGFGEFGEDSTGALALGMQLGPKIAIDADNHGIGYETVVLAGYTYRTSRTVLNLGGLIDPGPTLKHHQNGFEGGVDFHLELDNQKHFALLLEIGGVHFVSNDQDQLHVSAGVAYSASRHIDFSLTALGAVLDGGGQRAGLLFGVSPNVVFFQ